MVQAKDAAGNKDRLAERRKHADEKAMSAAQDIAKLFAQTATQLECLAADINRELEKPSEMTEEILFERYERAQAILTGGSVTLLNRLDFQRHWIGRAEFFQEMTSLYEATEILFSDLSQSVNVDNGPKAG